MKVQRRSRPLRTLAGVAVILAIVWSEPGLSITKHTASLGELFTEPLHRHASISPSGRYAVIIVRQKHGDGIRVHDVQHGLSVEVSTDSHCRYRSVCGTISSLDWVDSDTLIVGFDEPSQDYNSKLRKTSNVLIDFDIKADSVVTKVSAIGRHGIVVSPLPDHDDEILFWPHEDENAVYRLDPHYLGVEKGDLRVAIANPDSEVMKRVASLEEDVYRWITDADGNIRSAVTLTREPVKYHIWYRASPEAAWKIIHTSDEPEKFDDLVPLGFSADSSRLVVASSSSRDRYGLYEYDPNTNALGDLIYEHPTAQLIDLVFDYSNREILAAVYFEEGERKYAYLDSRDEELRSAVRSAFGDQGVSITGLSRDRRRAAVRVSRSADAGAFWVLDLDSGGASEIGRIRPWLDNNLLAETQSFKFERSDGVVIDGFLTTPPMEGPKPPLVVMPHGGPIGVADARGFSPEVQYLARSGFAVLRINYRGSGSYGRRFEKLGYRQWGRGIEDDIDAAIDYVIKKQWVDQRKMCTMGASYGGYSALMLVIRHPNQFRCAASLMGVTDIPLMFNADALWLTESEQKQMVAFVGNPDEDYKEQQKYSPVYNAGKIKVPVYLAHGELDRRVNIEHMTRMKLILEFEKVPVDTYTMLRTGHGFRTHADAIRYWKSLRAFLIRHIAP